MPIDVKRVANRTHPEYDANVIRWRWLLDSYVGGNQYRYAHYGFDSAGMPIRNLIRHKREYPIGAEHVDSVGLGYADDATRNDYTLRLARTPVPDIVSEVVRKHVSRIMAREVDREGPESYVAWTKDIDGKGTDVDTWMRDEVAPLLRVYGCIDVIADHPPATGPVASEADRRRQGLSRVEAKLIHPTDVIWWRVDRYGRYEEVTIRERAEIEDPKTGHTRTADYLRHWTGDAWYLISDGKLIAEGAHPYGRPPVVRLFAAKHPSYRHIGLSPVETVAERQREIYNRDSELVLSDAVQAHPILQGPEDYTREGSDVPIGPGHILPKRKGPNGEYEAFEVLEFPKGAAESIRTNRRDLRDDIDRSAALAKPAGSHGGSVVAQSGISKGYDHAELGDLLSSIADNLAAAEREIGRLVVLVATDGKGAGSPPVEVTYSHQFDLIGADELMTGLERIQELISAAGRMPKVEAAIIYQATAELLPGLSEDRYEEFWKEIEGAVTSSALGQRETDDDDDDDESNPEGSEPGGRERE